MNVLIQSSRNLSAEILIWQNARYVGPKTVAKKVKIKMAAMKTSPSLVNFFIYNSTFGPKEGMVSNMILKDDDLL